MPKTGAKKQKPSLPKLRKQRARIVQDLHEKDFIDQTISADVYDSLLLYIIEYVSKNDDFGPGIEDIGDGSYFDEVRDDEDCLALRLQSARNLIDPYIGKRLTRQMSFELAIKISGQFDEIREGRIKIGGWDGSYPSISLLNIRSLDRIASKKGRLYSAKIRAYTGLAAGCQWSQLLTGGYIQQLIREIGALKYKKYSDLDLVGMWFIATVCNNKIYNPEVASSQKAYNRRLAKARKSDCPIHISPRFGKECRPCPIGRSSCPISRFDSTYSTVRMCVNKHRGYFCDDKELTCLACKINGV